MNKLATLVLAGTILFFSCTPDSGEKDKTEEVKLRKANGERFYGGTFNLSESEKYRTLFPPAIIDAISYRIASQVFEGLVKFDQENLKVIPSLAESWEIDSSGTVYTFKLRENVLFHDDPIFKDKKSRTVTAEDFKFIFEHLAAKGDEYSGFSMVMKDKVKGAAAYYESPAEGDLEGIKVIDNHTLQITLEKPYSDFLFLLATPFAYVFPKEAHEKYGEELIVGTGPFQLGELNKDKFIELERNPDYYLKDEHGNQLPFLDKIKVEFIEEKKNEVDAFKAGDLDMIYRLPTEYIIDILEVKYDQGKTKPKEYIEQRTPEMSTQYYEFLTVNTVFENKDVRKAFNYAVDKQLIVDKILQGEAFSPGFYGITPPVFDNYDVTQIEGYRFDPEKAKALMKKAGYENGKGFPELTLAVNKGGGLNIKVAEEVKRQLKENLKVDINLNVMSLSEKIDKAKKGELEFFRSAWIADYPSPANFLMLLYGKDVPSDLSEPAYPNTSRYKNGKFDELYEKGLHTTSLEEAYSYFMKAEQLAMKDAPYLVLWYDENYRILQPYVKNFPANPMQFRDFSAVWFDNESLGESDTTAAEPQAAR